MEKYDTIPSAGPGELNSGSFRAVKAYVVGAVSLGLTSIVLLSVWLGHYRGGFAWQEDPAHQFNYHPLFMVLGLVFLYGNSILIYRVFPNYKKIYVKILHSVLHILALVFAGIGLKAVFDSHNLAEKPTPNLYSLHSWLGLIAVIMFALQWMCGLITFLVPGLSMELRALYKPIHVFWGLVIFLLSIATALMGFTEKEIFANAKYSTKNSEGLLVNVLGLVLVALAVLVSYIVTNPAYQRQPLPEEEQMQLTQ